MLCPTKWGESAEEGSEEKEGVRKPEQTGKWEGSQMKSNTLSSREREARIEDKGALGG